MNNLFKIILIVVVVAVIAGIVIFFVTRPSSPAGQSGSVAGSETSHPVAGAPATLTIPAGDTIQMGTTHGTVTVKNFYKNIIESEDEFIVIAKASTYEVTYDNMRNSFYIQLLTNSSADKAGAEQAFLGLLGVNQSDACKFSVAESSGSGLSFCTGGAFQAQ